MTQAFHIKGETTMMVLGGTNGVVIAAPSGYGGQLLLSNDGTKYAFFTPLEPTATGMPPVYTSPPLPVVPAGATPITPGAAFPPAADVVVPVGHIPVPPGGQIIVDAGNAPYWGGFSAAAANLYITPVAVI